MTSLRLAVCCLAVALVGCGPNLCDRSTKAATATAGDCGDFAGPLLGNSCNSNLSACSEADQKLIASALTCLEGISLCNSLAKDAWKLQRDGCTAQLATLSQPCASAFFQGTPPGVDAGVPDAGLPPINDGGAGLTLFGVANTTTLALAWEPKRVGPIDRYLLVETDGVGENRVESTFPPGTALNLTFADDGGMRRRHYFIAGLNAAGEVVVGMPLNTSMVDAGTAMCRGPNDCDNDRVCDLGQCRAIPCQPNMTNTCPSGYACGQLAICQRTTADGGIFTGGGGRVDAGQGPLPLISNEVDLTPRPPMISPTVDVGFVGGKRPDIAAFDTARVALGLEQEGQLIVHASTARGSDFLDEATTSFSLDTTGARLHLAWNPDSQLLYACYMVGSGVRVQQSPDRGRTWAVKAVTFDPPVDDAGISEVFRDCDIAPWKNGGAIVVTAEPGKLVTRELTTDLAVTATSTAFTAIPADAGTAAVFAPSHPAIATQLSTGLVHITFTGTRLLTGGASDTEPYGVFREGTAVSFSPASRMTPFAAASALPEDWTTVSSHPKTGRFVGAFTTVQNATQNSTVYVSLFSTVSRAWGTGSHLNVFVTDQNTSVWLPQKAPTDQWFAFSPQFAPLPDGTFAFSFVAGPHNGQSGDYRMYMVPFDLDRVPSITSGKGWFVPPVMKVSDDRVLDPRGSFSGPQPPVSAITADGQISVYGVFIPGGGVAGDVEGPAKYFSWP